MKTEKGLASHSSNMVPPHDYHCEPEDGWTVVTSKKNLFKTRKNKKNDINSMIPGRGKCCLFGNKNCICQ